MIRIKDSKLKTLEIPNDLLVYNQVSGQVTKGPDIHVSFRSNEGFPNINVHIGANVKLQTIFDETPQMKYKFEMSFSSGGIDKTSMVSEMAQDLQRIARWAEDVCENIRKMGLEDFQEDIDDCRKKP